MVHLPEDSALSFQYLALSLCQFQMLYHFNGHKFIGLLILASVDI